MTENGSLGRNLAMELVRVTEAAAIRAARWVGSGDKVSADKAARDAVHDALGYVDMDGVTVLSEGEKDQAPMIPIGAHVGNGKGPQVDFAVDPIDGTTLTARGLPNAISVVAVAERGAMFTCPHVAYMEKIAVGAQAKGAIDINASVEAQSAPHRAVLREGDSGPHRRHPRPAPPREPDRRSEKGRGANQADFRRRRGRGGHGGDG